jgi:hypothetical protein
MKYYKLILFLLLFPPAEKVKSQTVFATPMYNAYYPTASKLLDRKVWDLFEATGNNGFVAISFDVSQNGVVTNLAFSKNFPILIKEFIIKSFHPESAKWIAAKIRNIPVARKLVWPIVYQYNGVDNFDTKIDNIIDAMEFINYPGSVKGIIDAVIMPVCKTGFSTTKK